MLRDARTARRTARPRVATARPPSDSEITQSVSLSLAEAWTTRSPSIAGPSAVAQKVSPRIGSQTAPTAGRPSTTRPTETQKYGIPFA